MIGIYVGWGISLFTNTKAALLPLVFMPLFVLLWGGWQELHERTMVGSPINWQECKDLRRAKNAIIRLGITCLIAFLISIWQIQDVSYDEVVKWWIFAVRIVEKCNIVFNAFSCKILLSIFPYFCYLVFCDYILIKGKLNALFHTRVLFLIPVLLIVYYFLCVFYFRSSNKFLIGSDDFLEAYFIFFPIVLFIMACFLQIVALTFRENVKAFFSSGGGTRINVLDIFVALFVTILSYSFLFIIDYSPLQKFFPAAEINKKEVRQAENVQPVAKQTEQNDKGTSTASTVTFHPQNANIIDSEGSHNFSSYDCPNMNVTDNGNTVSVSWGGDTVVLQESDSNNDTYIATGGLSRKATIKAMRSSASGKIYLVTVAMPNPSPNVNYITINFKP